jgi:LmbE family N-acetylglucosaminyl deacetylase
MMLAMTGPAGDGDLGTILAVFAHPDDEAYLAGALMATAVDAGRRVVCVTATRGELGFPDDDPRPVDERKAVREAELAACLAVLGVEEHLWLDLPDGGCHAVADDGPVNRLTAVIDDMKPDTVLTFGPDGQTYHQDHMAISRWTTWAVEATAHPTRLLYAAMTPEWIGLFADHGIDLDQVMMVPGAEPQVTAEDDLAVWFVADGELLERKVRALLCQASQVGTLVDQVGLDTYALLNRDETFRAATAADHDGLRRTSRSA